MANDEVIGPRKTMFVLVIVVGCFAVLWPRILSPLVLGPTREQIQPNQFDREAGCCEVIFETDVAVLELVNEVCSSALGAGKLTSHSAAECRKAVNDTCGVDIAVFLKRNENVGKTTKMLVETMQNSNSSCLREHFGVQIYSLGPHIAAKSWNIKDTLKQERAPPIRGMGPHPALRERGRAIPPSPPGPPPPPSRPVTLPPHVRVRSPLSVYYKDEQVSSVVFDVWLASAEWPQYQPPPIPGMRPPLGSPGGPVPAPKSSMGFVMPIYTICIIVFFVYTLTKIMFRRQGPPYEPITPDPHFRRRVFRDDSRSSPEKLGKKEADTIVTAISGLVAEVQQQMEASGAPNQQRQDVQDSARPFTNGTILLNSGPVQIVTSEYKEASKEKTPEPVIDKQSMPEPTQAEIIKVLNEPVSKEDEYNLEPNESHLEVEQSPEPVITQQENQAILETVVIKESSPESVVLEESSLTSHTEPKLVKKEPPLDPNQSDEPSIHEVAKDYVLETLSESELFLDSTLKPNLTLEGLSMLSDDIALVSDDKNITSEIEESFLETKAEAVEDQEKILATNSEPIKSPSELVISTLDSHPEKLIDPNESTLLSSNTTLELKESAILSNESLANPDQTYIEPENQHIIPAPELEDPSLDPLPPAIHPEVTSRETSEGIIQSKNILQSEEPNPLFDESVIHKQSLTEHGDDYSLQPIVAIPEPKDPSLDLLTLASEPNEPTLESIETAPELKEPLLDSLTPNIVPEETSLEPSESVIQSKELSMQPDELTSVVRESPTKLQDPIKEPSLQPELANPEPKDPSLDLLPLAPESDEQSLEPTEPTPKHKDLLLETIADFKEPSESENTESNESLSNIKESVHEPVIVIPEQQTVTEDTDQFIPEHKDSATPKVSTPELLETSTEIKEPIVESSSGSKLSEYSPKIEAQNVDHSSEPEHIEYSPKLEAPVVECSSELENSVQSLEIDTPGVGSNSGSKSESIILKDPTSQSKETTPERKLTPEPKTIQVEQNDTVSEGALLDLEEAIADVDDRIHKQDKKDSTDTETKLQTSDSTEQKVSEELLKVIEDTEALNDVEGDAVEVNDKFLQGERFVVVRRSTPDVIEENKKLHPYESKSADDYKLYTGADEEDIENAAVKVMAMEMTAHPVDGSEWPRDERPPPPAAPVSPPPRAPHAAEEVKSIFLETEIPQQSRVLVAQFEEDRPHPAAHAPLVVSGKMTLSLIQDAPRDTPDRDPESTLDEFTTASAVTQAAAEKGEIESDEEIDEEIEVEEIELEEEEEEEEPPPAKGGKK